MVTVHSDNKETLLLLLDGLFLPIRFKSSFKNETDTLCDNLLKMRLIHCVTSHCVVETSQTYETDTLCDKSLCCWDQSNLWDWYTVWQVTVLLRPVKPKRLIHCVTSHCVVETSQTQETDTLCDKSLCCWDQSNPWDWYTVWQVTVLLRPVKPKRLIHCVTSQCCWDQSSPWDWYTVWQVTVLLRSVKPMRLIHCETSHCVVETSQTHETDTLCDKSLCCWDQTHETDTLCDKSLCCWDQSNPWDWYTVWQVTVLLRPVQPMRLIHCVTSHCVVETSPTHETDTLCDKSLCCWDQSNPRDWYTVWQVTVLLRPVKPMRLIHCVTSHCVVETSQTHETDTLCDKSLCCWDQSNQWDWYTVWQVTVLLRPVKPMRLIYCVTSHCVVETSQTHETDILWDKSLCCWDKSNPWDWYTVWQVTVLLIPVKPMRLIHCVTSHCVVETSQTHETDTLCDKSLCCWDQSNQ